MATGKTVLRYFAAGLYRRGVRRVFPDGNNTARVRDKFAQRTHGHKIFRRDEIRRAPEQSVNVKLVVGSLVVEQYQVGTVGIGYLTVLYPAFGPCHQLEHGT